jgi:hypothetical protein
MPASGLGGGERVVQRGGGLVGEGFDALLGLAAGIRETAVGVDDTALAQPVHDLSQPLFGRWTPDRRRM